MNPEVLQRPRARNHIAVLVTMCMAVTSMSVTAVDRPAPRAEPSKNQVAAREARADKIADRHGRYLYYLEFDGEPAIFASDAVTAKAKAQSKAVISRRAELKQQQDKQLAVISRKVGRNVPLSTRHELLLNGVTAYLSSREVELLRDVEGIVTVQPVPRAWPHTDRGPIFVGAPTIWNGSVSVDGTMGEGVIVGIIDTGIDPHHRSFADVGDDGYDHVNPLGSGVYLGDCAKDAYRHLCNDKLIGIVSYPEITGYHPPKGEEAGIDYVGHGTHVASIAAGNVLHNVPIYDFVSSDVDTGLTFDTISGVAPHANIVAYQICTPPNDGNGDPIEIGPCFVNLTVDALEHAIEHGVDVINYSIGGNAGDPWSHIDSKAFLNARKAGLHVATSAGNLGPNPETGTTPSNSPWVISVAAATHDRAYSEKQLALTGGDTTPPAAITGKSATAGFGPAPIVHADAFENPWCSEPFPDDTFSGEIVVCGRGINARVEKGTFLRDAGAGGMILENLVDSGPESNLVDDFHVLPAMHISNQDGILLYDWLSSGVGHAAQFNASVSAPDAGVADVIAGFSSRGPNIPHPDLRTIDVAAPGSFIYAAMIENQPFHDEPDASSPFAQQSGTSMASPHVAGAAALLHARHPDWSPAELQSAMMLTAAPGMLQENFDDKGRIVQEPADLHAEGSGSLRADRAVNAGLVMPVEYGDYIDADPAIGGNVAQLNMPVLISNACLSECSWTRRFRAVHAGNWTIEFDIESPSITLAAEPSTFSLAAGETITVIINAEVTDPDTSRAHHARLRLVSSDPVHPELQMPVELFYAPGIAPAELTVTAHRDHDVVVIPDIRTAGFEQLDIVLNGLLPSEQLEAFTEGDTTPDLLGDDFESPWHIVPIDVSDDTVQISARILEADAPDLDLFVVPDNNDNGRMDVIELQAILGGFENGCFSAGPDSIEACTADKLTADRYFLGVHNYLGTDEGSDRHVVQVAVVGGYDDGNLVFDDPGARGTNESFDLVGTFDVDFDGQPSMYGMLLLGLDSTSRGNVGAMPVEIVRGEDDVAFTYSTGVARSGDEATMTVTILKNESELDRTYMFSLNGRSELLSPEGFETESSADAYQWTWTQVAGADLQEFQFELRVPEDAAGQELEFTLTDSVVVAGKALKPGTRSANIAVTPHAPKPGGGGALGWLLIFSFAIRLWRR